MPLSIADAIAEARSPGSTIKTIAPDKVGFAGLTSESFLKILIAQLQNQDPTNPTDNKDLVAQLNSIQGLQANVELQTTLKSFSQSDQLSGASALIGKKVTGSGANNETITGVVDRVSQRDGKSYLGIGTKELPYNNVKDIKLDQSALSSLLESLPQL